MFFSIHILPAITPESRLLFNVLYFVHTALGCYYGKNKCHNIETRKLESNTLSSAIDSLFDCRKYNGRLPINSRIVPFSLIIIYSYDLLYGILTLEQHLSNSIYCTTSLCFCPPTYKTMSKKLRCCYLVNNKRNRVTLSDFKILLEMLDPFKK